MDWNIIGSPIVTVSMQLVSVVAGGFAVYSRVSRNIGKYEEKISNLERLIQKTNDLEKQVAALQQFEKNASPKIFIAQSPLTLTIYARNLLKDIDFYDFFDSVKEDLAQKIERLKLKTRYDIQEKSKEILQEIKDDDLFIPLKTKAFDKGKSYDDIILAASIPLRDYYLSIHPEIKD